MNSLILALQSASRDNPLTREDLCYYTGLPDRQARRYIHELRTHGYPIVMNESGKGYWMADTMREVEIFIASLESRKKSLQNVIDAMQGVSIQKRNQ
jgi:DNA-binding IclR family transcriptional regulator